MSDLIFRLDDPDEPVDDVGRVRRIRSGKLDVAFAFVVVVFNDDAATIFVLASARHFLFSSIKADVIKSKQIIYKLC